MEGIQGMIHISIEIRDKNIRESDQWDKEVIISLEYQVRMCFSTGIVFGDRIWIHTQGSTVVFDLASYHIVLKKKNQYLHSFRFSFFKKFVYLFICLFYDCSWFMFSCSNCYSTAMTVYEFLIFTGLFLILTWWNTRN